MSALAHIISRLRAAGLAELQRLHCLYAGQPETLKLIEKEFTRRQTKLNR